jgi:selenium metabolism protein YedF
MFVDARGKTCPIPVLLAKKELDGGCNDLTVAVDNQTAVENLTRLASSRGLQAATEEKDGVFTVRMTGEGTAKAVSEPVYASCGPAGCGTAVFIGKDHVGDGAQELGYNLLKMALYTLGQSDDVPAYVLFMNGGVKLPAGDDQPVLDSIKTLADKGAEVLVCGTCLSYYGLTDKCKIGTVSNMYDILSRMQKAAKVITL